LIQDCYRILKPGGRFRIALPNFRRSFEAYLNGDDGYFSLLNRDALDSVPGLETILDYVHYSVYQSGEHKCLYDEKRVCKMLNQAGFQAAQPVQFDPTIDVDVPLRRAYSFYVEAVK
jgi:predicted SAM-dependent methyltransferase